MNRILFPVARILCQQGRNCLMIGPQYFGKFVVINLPVSFGGLLFQHRLQQ